MPPATNIFQQSFDLSRKDRETLKGHTGKVIWFTGLSGSGKSTLANALEQALHLAGKHTWMATTSGPGCAVISALAMLIAWKTSVALPKWPNS